MANIRLTVQHGDGLYEPPVEDGVKIEWETNAAGKLTFTAVNTGTIDSIITEGDVIRFYCDDKPVFLGYVFSKKRDRDQNVEVTCYDQIRYMKNKFSYIFQKRHAHTILQLLCDDLGLKRAAFSHTMYPIPELGEENISALDIINKALEETLLNIGEKFVMYDDFGKIQLKNCTEMKSTTLIAENTAENFDYKSSIDSDTYNQVVLYYKGSDDNPNYSYYGATGTTRVKEWGLLRYFEETDTTTAAQQKANALLKLYNRKTRELSITGAFGDVTVRGGTLIPVKLNLQDVRISNYMLVDKVTHNFTQNHHTMDLTISGDFGDEGKNTTDNVVSETVPPPKFKINLAIEHKSSKTPPLAGAVRIALLTQYNYELQQTVLWNSGLKTIECDAGTKATLYVQYLSTTSASALGDAAYKNVKASVAISPSLSNGFQNGRLTSDFSVTNEWRVRDDGIDGYYVGTVDKDYDIIVGW